MAGSGGYATWSLAGSCVGRLLKTTLLPLWEKVAAKRSDEGFLGASAYEKRGRWCDPSSVDCVDTFSRKGRRKVASSAG
ncbi:hypothetical protein CA607_17090 [Caulobacter vibrioides]|nr:hypothetical protein CA607_17090 [Caulobacter vibrioides]